MLRFFRRIRQRLFTQNKFSISLLYALSSSTRLGSLALTPGDPNTLLKNPDFEDFLVQILWNVQHTNIQSEGVNLALDKIVEHITIEQGSL
jgi:hypothetical protein